ncbi:MAG: MaoC/PaaZ C-terminal domain-containing protein [Alphaproteobacteria bacterium]
MSLLQDIEDYVVYFDDLNIGDSFQTPSRTITEADVTNFACLSGDFNRLHVDVEYANATQFGQRIAHGLCVLAIASGLTTRLPLIKFIEKTLIALANLECRWVKPTFIGDTIHVDVEIIAKEETSKPDRGLIVMRRTAINQRDEAVMESEWKLLMRRRG